MQRRLSKEQSADLSNHLRRGGTHCVLVTWWGRGREDTDEACSFAGDFVRCLSEAGWEVCTKPMDAQNAHGVTVGVAVIGQPPAAATILVDALQAVGFHRARLVPQDPSGAVECSLNIGWPDE